MKAFKNNVHLIFNSINMFFPTGVRNKARMVPVTLFLNTLLIPENEIRARKQRYLNIRKEE